MNVKKFLCWVVKSRTAPSGKIAGVLEAKMGGCKKRNFTSISAITPPLFSQEASTREVRQIFRAPTSVRTYAVNVVRL